MWTLTVQSTLTLLRATVRGRYIWVLCSRVYKNTLLNGLWKTRANHSSMRQYLCNISTHSIWHTSSANGRDANFYLKPPQQNKKKDEIQTTKQNAEIFTREVNVLQRWITVLLVISICATHICICLFLMADVHVCVSVLICSLGENDIKYWTPNEYQFAPISIQFLHTSHTGRHSHSHRHIRQGV